MEARRVKAWTLEMESLYQEKLHRMSGNFAAICFIAIPLLFVVDIFVVSIELLTRFVFYRFAAALVLFVQYFIIHHGKPSKWSVIHIYFSLIVNLVMIDVMLAKIGGVNSEYYLGIILAYLSCNIIVPLRKVHAIAICVIAILSYLVTVLYFQTDFEAHRLFVVFCFMVVAAVLSVFATSIRYDSMLETELLSIELKKTQGHLWGESSLAHRIQTSVLPANANYGAYDIACVMNPADEVGGDYYDVIRSRTGEEWIAIGDVSGQGIETSLLVLMVQTAIYSTINKSAGSSPTSVLSNVNSVLKENVSRLGTERYMTVSVARLEPDGIVFAGKHQDVLVYRAKKKITEFIPTRGTWLGIVDNVGEFLQDTHVSVSEGDVILFFTDGVLEAVDQSGQMFGERKLEQELEKLVDQPPATIVLTLSSLLNEYIHEQKDDFTLMVLKRKAGRGSRI